MSTSPAAPSPSATAIEQLRPPIDRPAGTRRLARSGAPAPRADASQVAHQRRPDRAPPPHRLVEHFGRRMTGRRSQPLGGIDGAEDLGQRRPVVLELEAEVRAPAREPMRRAGQTMAIDLEA